MPLIPAPVGPCSICQDFSPLVPLRIRDIWTPQVCRRCADLGIPEATPSSTFYVDPDNVVAAAGGWISRPFAERKAELTGTRQVQVNGAPQTILVSYGLRSVLTPLRRHAFNSSLVCRENGCVWMAAKPDVDGYSQINMTIRKAGEVQQRKYSGHQVAWFLRNGYLPHPITGLQLDHRCHSEDQRCEGGYSCRHRRCVNPDHLELVTAVENLRRARQQRTLRRLRSARPESAA